MKDVPDPRLFHPCTIRVVGATMSGKTHFVHNLLKHRNEVFGAPVQRVLYCYGSDQDLFQSMKREDPHIVFHAGLPEEPYKQWLPQGGIVVLDDLMDRVVNDAKSTHLFTKGAHHDGISPISIEQNLFAQGRGGRTQRLNTQYLILFKNPSDSLGPATWARQAFANRPDLKDTFSEAFHRSCQRPYGYLCCDMHPRTLDAFRFRTNILPTDPQPHHTYYMAEEEEGT